MENFNFKDIEFAETKTSDKAMKAQAYQAWGKRVTPNDIAHAVAHVLAESPFADDVPIAMAVMLITAGATKVLFPKEEFELQYSREKGEKK